MNHIGTPNSNSSNSNIEAKEILAPFAHIGADIATTYGIGKLLNADEKDSALLAAGSILAGDVISSFIVNKLLINFDTQFGTGGQGSGSDLTFAIGLPIATRFYSPVYVVSNPFSFAEALVAGYHGYKRNNDNLGYGLAWGLLGQSAGIGLALAQGYAKPLKK